MFSREDVEKIVFETIKLHAKKGVLIAPESKIIEDLGLKHDYVYMDIDLERKFGVEIPDSEFLAVFTVNDLVNVYYNYLNSHNDWQA